MVMLQELDPALIDYWPITLVFGVLFVFYALLNFTQKLPVLTFFSIANATVFVYFLVQAILDGTSYPDDVYAYLTMAVGASYLLLAQSFRGGWNDKLVNMLQFFGSAGFSIAAFTQVFDSGLWQVVYFAVIAGGLYLSIIVRSRSILAVSTLSLIAHVSYITSEYFADSIGWPISLVILGLMFIGLGYASITINARYIKEVE